MPSSSPLTRKLIVALASAMMQLSVLTPALARDPVTSPQFADSFTEAQRAVMQMRWADVIANATSVLASTGPKSDDAYAANYFLLQAYRGMRNAAEMRKALRAMLDTDVPSPEQRMALLHTIDQIDASQ